jgi:hypothetical protein
VQSNNLFDDGPDINKESQMTLSICSKWKRDNAADGEGPRVVKRPTRTISLQINVIQLRQFGCPLCLRFFSNTMELLCEMKITNQGSTMVLQDTRWYVGDHVHSLKRVDSWCYNSSVVD